MKLIKKLFKLIFCIVFIPLFIIVSVITFQGYSLYKDVTNNISIENKVNDIKSNKDYISLNQIPDGIKNGTIAIEDHRFYNHKGFDIISTSRAIITNISNKKLVSGGSTITQQLAKNMYFSQEKKFSRKVAELILAYKLEKNYSKEDILELYLNVIYYGDGYTGVKNASIGYFNKSPKELSLYEQTLLVALPNAPSVYALSEENNYAYTRQKYVINAMVKYNYLTQDEANNILNKKE